MSTFPVSAVSAPVGLQVFSLNSLPRGRTPPRTEKPAQTPWAPSRPPRPIGLLVRLVAEPPFRSSPPSSDDEEWDIEKGLSVAGDRWDREMGFPRPSAGLKTDEYADLRMGYPSER